MNSKWNQRVLPAEAGSHRGVVEAGSDRGVASAFRRKRPHSAQTLAALLAGLVASTIAVSTAGQAPRTEAPLKMRPRAACRLFGGARPLHACATEKAKTFAPPRTADGQPDLRGHWGRASVTSDNIEEHAEVVGDPGGKSFVVDPPDGNIPYQPWAQAKRQDNAQHYIAPQALCFQPASPRGAYAPGRIPDSPDQGRARLPPRLRAFLPRGPYRRPSPCARQRAPGDGDLRGRWEGNTLVVDSRNFTGKAGSTTRATLRAPTSASRSGGR